MNWEFKREKQKNDPIDWGGINEIVKANVTIEQVLRAYVPGVKIGRYRRIACPIHGGTDKNFSYDDHFYHCFSVCGDGGDVIKLTITLLGLDYLGAIKRLNNDFNLGLPLTGQMTGEEALRTQKRIAEAAKRIAEQNARREEYEAQYDHLMGAWISGDILSRAMSAAETNEIKTRNIDLSLETPECGVTPDEEERAYQQAEGKAVMTIYSYLLDRLGDISE